MSLHHAWQAIPGRVDGDADGHGSRVLVNEMAPQAEVRCRVQLSLSWPVSVSATVSATQPLGRFGVRVPETTPSR